MKGSIVPMVCRAPQLRINMALAPRRWVCEPYQLLQHRNRNYLHSLWLGTVVNLLNLPVRLMCEVLMVLLIDGAVVSALVNLFFSIPVSTVCWLAMGLLGCLDCAPVSAEVMSRARLADRAEQALDREAGERAFVKQVGRRS